MSELRNVEHLHGITSEDPTLKETGSPMMPTSICYLTRRRAGALFVTIALVAAACGSDATEDAEVPATDVAVASEEPSTPDTVASVAVESDGEQPTPTEPTVNEAAEPVETNEASDDAEPAGDAPLRVVDLADFMFDLSTLDVELLANIYGPEFLTPVVSAAPLTDEQRAAVLAADNVAPAFELNVEQVLALEPDLIITGTSFVDFFPGITQLEEAANVVLIDDTLGWRERSQATADAVDMPGAFDQRIADAEASIVELAARVESLGLVGTEVSLLRAFRGEITAFNPPSIASTVVAEAGLTQPAAQLVDQPADSMQPDYAAQTILSSELLGDHNADYAIIANTVDLSSATAELPPDLPIELIPVLDEGGTHVVASYLFTALNSVIGVERIVLDINLLLDEIEAE